MTTRLVIKTPRLIVDDFTNHDLPSLTGIFQRMKQAGQSWYNADPDNPASIQSFLQQTLDDQAVAPRDTYRMAIRAPQTDGCTPLIGYVSLCDIFSKTAGTPDTGVFVDPQFQRGRYAREARIAIMAFGFAAGIENMYSDIALNNHGSQQNVLGMGYDIMKDANGQPAIHQTKTLTGSQPVHRFILSRDKFWQTLPGLVHDLVAKIDPSGTLTAQMNKAAAGLTEPSVQALPAPFTRDIGPFTINTAAAMAAPPTGP